jgi:hypothetical protein
MIGSSGISSATFFASLHAFVGLPVMFDTDEPHTLWGHAAHFLACGASASGSGATPLFE